MINCANIHKMFRFLRFILKVPKKFLIPLVILIIIISFFVFKPKSTANKLEFVNVKKQDIKTTVSSSGNLTGTSVANLKFKSSGKLAYIKVKSGDTVKKGQLIASLDTRELDIALQQAYNTFIAKDAAAKKAEDDVKNHSSDETFTQKDTRTTAQVARDNAFDNIKLARKTLDDAIIFAPFDGVVTQAMDVEGQVISITDIVAQIVDYSGFYFDTDVDEADISKVAIGAEAEVTLDAYLGEKFIGKVDQIKPQTKITSSGATVVTVRILLENPKLVFVNGLSGESSILNAVSFNALTIPQEALRDDSTVVIEGADKKLKAKKIETGISSDTDIEIKSGLTEGEKVLLNPPSPGSKLN